MIVYFDTSALVPLLTDELGSDAGVALWEVADRKVSARVACVESRAALAAGDRALGAAAAAAGLHVSRIG